MFNIKLDITPDTSPSVLNFADASTGDETVTSRKVAVTKTDLLSQDYLFPTGETVYKLDTFDKDYALNVVYTVVTTVGTYTKTYEFVLLGYTNILKKNRILAIENNNIDQEDEQRFKADTLDINYYKMVAKNRVKFSDLIGAQKALDYITDIGLNSKANYLCQI